MHHLLKRQMKKCNLSNQNLPEDRERWLAFIAMVDKYYHENDQERYLLERSMEISSIEMVGINEQMEYAQKLARLCHWQWSPTSCLIHWSKNIFDLLNLNDLMPAPTYIEFIDLIHEKHRKKVKNCIENAISNNADDDFDILLKVQEDNYKWFRIFITNKNNVIVSGILIDINKEKENSLLIEELNKTLISTARLAGMSEIATTILHNIGNLLNSIFVSIMILKNNLTIDSSNRFFTIVNLIKDHKNHLDEYLSQDEKGQLIVPYLEQFSAKLHSDFLLNNEHIARLEKNLEHVKDIVTMQQALSGVDGIKEEINLSELMINAIDISSIKSYNIELNIEIQEGLTSIVSDKSKLLQILINLLRNSKDAVNSKTDEFPKKINVFLHRYTDNQITIKVIDNGIGIPDEIQDKIFSFGFTTKKHGHGFGLHSSALAAKELGGSLSLRSKGAGKGAVFTLTVPMKPRQGENYEK